MVLLGGELRQAVIDWSGLLAFVDCWIEIDEVPAGLAGGVHEDLDIALAVEAAGIAAVAVVVDHRVDVGGFAPAHTFEMNLERSLDRPAGEAVIAPIWGRFLSTYPEVHLELAVGEATIDIVAKGFDAGIGPHDRAPADMIAVRVTGPMKIAVVGAPAYFARRRPPRTPDNLARHRCVRYRRPAAEVSKWTFKRDRK